MDFIIVTWNKIVCRKMNAYIAKTWNKIVFCKIVECSGCLACLAVTFDCTIPKNWTAVKKKEEKSYIVITINQNWLRCQGFGLKLVSNPATF